LCGQSGHFLRHCPDLEKARLIIRGLNEEKKEVVQINKKQNSVCEWYYFSPDTIRTRLKYSLFTSKSRSSLYYDKYKAKTVFFKMGKPNVRTKLQSTTCRGAITLYSASYIQFYPSCASSLVPVSPVIVLLLRGCLSLEPLGLPRFFCCVELVRTTCIAFGSSTGINPSLS
jgi:hypothetical protein